MTKHNQRECEWCGETFQPRTKGNQKPQQFCGAICSKQRSKAAYDLGKQLTDAVPTETLRAHYQTMIDADRKNNYA